MIFVALQRGPLPFREFFHVMLDTNDPALYKLTYGSRPAEGRAAGVTLV